MKEHGYSTSCFGKWHLTPTWEKGPTGPLTGGPPAWALIDLRDLGGEASQWEPAAYDQTTPIEPHIGKDNYHLSEDLADQAIKWIRQQQTSTPDSPFFCYFAPPAVHAPHQAPKEWIDKYVGAFDEGWDALRTNI
ncbi:MAG: hypothetical protein CM15mP49_16280 [Actinomycetota bacterium]|nr:MAG: hypothetical protein CM15mP49_16280 [Actinomycetota bacterium]